VDLDRFKEINDAHGHAIGDVVLREVATRLGECVRDADSIGRLGGDEFVLLLPDIDGEQDASRVAEKARQALAADIVIDGRAIPLSGSMGIAIYPQHGMTLSDLSNSAETAMYEAKANGPGTVRVFGQDEKR
jgi:diguanylate cyclase (GGDEF)-like protein